MRFESDLKASRNSDPQLAEVHSHLTADVPSENLFHLVEAAAKGGEVATQLHVELLQLHLVLIHRRVPQLLVLLLQRKAENCTHRKLL